MVNWLIEYGFVAFPHCGGNVAFDGGVAPMSKAEMFGNARDVGNLMVNPLQTVDVLKSTQSE